MREPSLAACPQLRAYLDRIGAEVLNFRRFMVKIHWRGYYHERAIVRVLDDFSLDWSHPEFAPTDEEHSAITEELRAANFPTPVETFVMDTIFDHVPRDATLYKFLSRINGNIIMVQQRLEFENGGKAYLPWTFFSDAIWRQMEPGGALPFWKPYEHRNKPSIMVHEGAKAAHFVDDLLNNPARIDELKCHPWADFFAEYEHWGMIGGALAPQRADYAELHREQANEVIYVCDNDFEGKEVLKKFSQHYNRPMKGVLFNDSYSKSWDCADPIPASHFHKNKRYNVKNHIRNQLWPATYATETKTVTVGDKKKNIIELSLFFKREWFHAIKPDVYVHRDAPDQILSPSEFDDMVNPYSIVDDTQRLMKRDQTSKQVTLIYNPSMPSGPCASNRINTYVAPYLPLIDDDPQPWLDYLAHTFPVADERYEICRWVATLITHPEIRMRYGLLLISEQQGVGKTTLTKILEYIIGENNTSHPADSDINSDYNYWAAHKRLVVISEIYAGNSSKTYNKLKAVMTDATISVNQKYKAVYELDNWVHIVASSNSKRALKLSDDDRRWFVPEVTEIRGELWESFYPWIESGGAAIIKNWAFNFIRTATPVSTSAPAPWSSIKREVIEATYSQGETLSAQIFSGLNALRSNAQRYTGNGVDTEEIKSAHSTITALVNQKRCRGSGNDFFVLDTDVVKRIKDEIHDGRPSQYLERPLTIRKIAKALGWYIGKVPVTLRAWPGSAYSRIIATNPDFVNIEPLKLANSGLLPLDLSDTTVWRM